MSCPNCDSTKVAVRESRRCFNGTRRRRMECSDCGNRWTDWDGPKPDHRQQPRAKGRQGGRFTADQIRDILLAPRTATHAELGRRFGITGEYVRHIRIGIAYSHVHPEIARWGKPAPRAAGKSCYRCCHWQGEECGFGFPDPGVEGPSFAADCDLYEVSQSISRACPTSVQ